MVTGSAAPYTYTITPIKVNAQALIEQIHNLDNRGTMNGFGRLLSRDEFVRARQVSGGQVESAHGPDPLWSRSRSGPTDRAAAISTPESKKVWIIGRSEVASPAVGYFALKLATSKRLFTRRGDLFGDPTHFPTES